jgi:HEAT repeat protein
MFNQLTHPDRNVRSQAALALGKFGDSTAIDALLEALYTEPDFFVREDITWALVRMGAEAIEPLIDLLKHESPEARHAAAHVLGKIGDKRAVKALIEALEDESIPVLTKSAFSLGQMDAVESVSALTRLIGHEDREVQTTITREIERFAETAFPLVVDLLKDERWQVREHAADILGLLDKQSAVPALIEALADEHWQVRFAAATALNALGEPNALSVLADDPDYRVSRLVTEIRKRAR